MFIENEELSLILCDSDLQYILDTLQNEKILFEKREKIAHSVLTKFLDLSTNLKRIQFLLCKIILLFILYTAAHSSSDILVKNMFEALILN